MTRQYSEAERKKAIAAVLDGKSQSEVARQLGCSVRLVYQWMHRYRSNQGNGNGVVPPPVAKHPPAAEPAAIGELSELSRLRSEVLELRREKEFLESVVSFFASQKRWAPAPLDRKNGM